MDLIIFSPKVALDDPELVTVGNRRENKHEEIKSPNDLIKYEFDKIVEVWFIGPLWLKSDIVLGMMQLGYVLKYLDYNSPIFMSKELLERL